MHHQRLSLSTFFTLFFCLTLLSHPLPAQAADTTNTLFLPLKTKSLQGDNFSQQMDEALAAAVAAEDQDYFSRRQAMEIFDYEGIWPPLIKRSAPLPPTMTMTIL